MSDRRLWIRFDFACGLPDQKYVFEEFRPKIRAWKKTGLIHGAIMTYHTASSNRLYVCMDIPSVPLPEKRAPELTKETVEQIPHEIMSIVKKIRENHPTIKLSLYDYKRNLMVNNSSAKYNNAPIDEILRFASTGTDIALGILEDKKLSSKLASTEVATYIYSRIQTTFGKDYPWIRWAFHFVCNPLLIPIQLDEFLWRIVSQQR